MHEAYTIYAPKIEHYAFEQCSKNHLLCACKHDIIMENLKLKHQCKWSNTVTAIIIITGIIACIEGSTFF